MHVMCYIRFTVIPASGGPAKDAIPAKKLLTPNASASLSIPTISATITDVKEIVTPEERRTHYMLHILVYTNFIQSSITSSCEVCSRLNI